MISTAVFEGWHLCLLNTVDMPKISTCHGKTNFFRPQTSNLTMCNTSMTMLRSWEKNVSETYETTSKDHTQKKDSNPPTQRSKEHHGPNISIAHVELLSPICRVESSSKQLAPQNPEQSQDGPATFYIQTSVTLDMATHIQTQDQEPSNIARSCCHSCNFSKP